MILVTAANGNQGRLLVPKLLAGGQEIRACVRTPASAAALEALGVPDVITGDLSDPAIASLAMRGVDAVYHVGPTLHPRERDMGMVLVDAARAAGAGHFVFSSVLHAITTDLVQHEIKRDVEEYLLSSGLEFTILQPANYMLPLKLRPVFERGVFELSWSLDRRQSMVDLGDVTDVAVLVLESPADHAGATYELAGPGRFTAYEIGEVLTRVIGRDIDVREIGAEAYAQSWVGERNPREVAHELRVLRAITTRYSSHDFIGNPNVLRWLLGRPPTTFEQYARAQYAAFTRSSH